MILPKTAIFCENRRKSSFSTKMPILAAFSAKMLAHSVRSRSAQARARPWTGLARTCALPRARYARPRFSAKSGRFRRKRRFSTKIVDFQRKSSIFAENPENLRFSALLPSRAGSIFGWNRPNARYARFWVDSPKMP